jgi:peptidylprolyl isomerase
MKKTAFHTALIGMVLALTAGLSGCGGADKTLGDGLFARITTARGEMILRLEYQKVPMTVCSFVALAEGKLPVAGGKPFYDGLSFHRVVSRANGDDQDFVIQGGDPLGNGSGGPGYSFPDEFDPSLKHDGPGVLSMANAGPNTNGSQFFITLSAQPPLDGRHSVFGRVIKGQEVAGAVKPGDRIEKITIIRNGPEAAAFRADEDAFKTLADAAWTAVRAEAQAKREEDLARIAEKYPGTSLSPSGIRYIILKQGNGPKPEPGSVVSVIYRGMFLSGEIFDGSDFHGGPLEFSAGIGQVIPGWDETILDMRRGEKRLAIIPPELAYGEQGAGGVIPPDTFLVFEMELVASR